MAEFITKAQYKELENGHDFETTAEYHKLLKKYTGIVARQHEAYSYFSEDGDYIGNSNEDDLDGLLRAAFVEVRDG